MVKPKDTDVKKSHIRCPRCDKELMQVVTTEDCLIKCGKCNRRYLINVKEGSISILLISKPKDDEK